MKNTLASLRAYRSMWTALIAVGIFAVASHWLDRFRLAPPDRAARSVFRVTSAADAGPGSLREAILAADRAGERARIEIQVPRVVINSPLPALVNPKGVVLDGGKSQVVLDATGAGEIPVLDVAAPDCVLRGVRIVHASGMAILIRRPDARILQVSVEDSAVGVYLADGARTLSVDASVFDRNDVGLQLSSDVERVTVQDSHFRGHRRAAVWAVAKPQLAAARAMAVHLARNEFVNDHQSLVLLNVGARVERNVFTRARLAAAYVSGASFLIQDNRILSGRAFGIDAERLRLGVIAANEIAHNCAGGILVRESHDTRVSSNRIYANGFGVVMVFESPEGPNIVVDNLISQHAEDGLYVIGGSPVVRGNRLLQNRRAGIRLSAAGPRATAPSPLMEANVSSGNGTDDVRRDTYIAARQSQITEPVECSSQGHETIALRAAVGGGR